MRLQKQENPGFPEVFSHIAPGGSRTRTPLAGKQILSLVRLPVPPRPLEAGIRGVAEIWKGDDRNLAVVVHLTARGADL